MTTQQIDRPLNEVDEAAERLQRRSGTGWHEADEDHRSWTIRTQEIVQRVARDRGSLVRAAILAVGFATVMAIVIAAARGRRRPPRTAEDLLLERSREAFDRARETLEAIASRLSSGEG